MMMLMLMCCSGASLLIHSNSFARTANGVGRLVASTTRSLGASGGGGGGARSRGVSPGALVLFVFLASVCDVGEAVGCIHCGGAAQGCEGSDKCPFDTTVRANVEAFGKRSLTSTPNLVPLLPPEMIGHFGKYVVETIISIVCSPEAGTSIDLSDEAYKTSASVVRAAVCGHCSLEDAGLELITRLEAAEVADVPKISAALDVLKVSGADKSGAVKTFAQSGYGLYSFIMAKIGEYIGALKTGTVKLAAATGKAVSSASELTVKMRRPENETEAHYYYYLFTRVFVALGCGSLFMIHDLIDKVVYQPMMRRLADWKLAFESLLVYFRAVEGSRGTLTIGTVFNNGSGDVYAAEARQSVLMFFRTSGGNLREGEKPEDKPVVKWNGKSTESNAKPCVAFNFAREHSRSSLDAAGCCKYSHKCMQWVSDKGPGGMCGGNHRKTECDYDESKKLSSALK